MTEYAIMVVADGKEREVRRIISKIDRYSCLVGKFKIPLRSVTKKVRNKKSKLNSWVESKEIAFPGYLFFQVNDDRWPLLLELRHVFFVMTDSNNSPYKIPSWVLDAVSSIRQKKDKNRTYPPKGTKIRIVTGSFMGLKGTVVERNVVEIDKFKFHIPLEFIQWDEK